MTASCLRASTRLYNPFPGRRASITRQQSRSKGTISSCQPYRWNLKTYAAPLSLTQFMEYSSLSHAETRVRNVVLDHLRAIVGAAFPKAAVRVFGSFATDLSLPTADLDVVVLTEGLDEDAHFDYLAGDKASKVTFMEQLAAHLVPAGFSKRTEINQITRARVPILKTIHQRTRVPVDISFDTTNGPAHTDMVATYLRTHPASRTVIMVMKHFLAQRGLNEPFSGGIGGYTLTCLVMSFFEAYPFTYAPDPALEEAFPDALALLDFLDFMAFKVNFQQVGISLVEGFFKRSHRKFDMGGGAGPLCVEDPQRRSSDIGAGAFAFDRIKSAMINAHSLLVRPAVHNTIVRDRLSAAGVPAPTVLSRVIFPDSRIPDMRLRAELVSGRTVSPVPPPVDRWPSPPPAPPQAPAPPAFGESGVFELNLCDSDQDGDNNEDNGEVIDIDSD